MERPAKELQEAQDAYKTSMGALEQQVSTLEDLISVLKGQEGEFSLITSRELKKENGRFTRPLSDEQLYDAVKNYLDRRTRLKKAIDKFKGFGVNESSFTIKSIRQLFLEASNGKEED